MFGLTNTERAGDLSDEEILARSTKEPWLFSILLDRYQDAFMRKARSVIFNEEDAEDIVQDTFVKIYKNASRFKPQEGAKFSSWGYRILMNTAFTKYQKKVKEGQRFTSIDPELEQLFGEKSNHSGFEESRDAIERILDQLPEHFALVLRLHFLERWSQEDIADSLNEKVGTIKARVHRAKEAFRKQASGEEDDLLS